MARRNLRDNCRLNLDALDQRVLPSTCTVTHLGDTGHVAALVTKATPRSVMRVVQTPPAVAGDPFGQPFVRIKNALVGTLISMPRNQLFGTGIGNDGSRGSITDGADPVG